MSHRTVPARYQSPQATSKGFRFNSANSPLLSSRRIVQSLRYAINTKKRNTEFLRGHFPWNFAPLISFADRKVIPWTSIRRLEKLSESGRKEKGGRRRLERTFHLDGWRGRKWEMELEASEEQWNANERLRRSAPRGFRVATVCASRCSIHVRLRKVRPPRSRDAQFSETTMKLHRNPLPDVMWRDAHKPTSRPIMRAD